MNNDDKRSDGRVFRVEGSERPLEVMRRSNAVENRNSTESVTVFLIISRFETDHALTYLFCYNAPHVTLVQTFVDMRPERFRGRNTVIELSEHYQNVAQARQRALGLGTWLGNVNIIFPPVRIN